MPKSAFLVSSILLAFSLQVVGQICFSSAYIPGASAQHIQPNAAGNYLILAGGVLTDMPPNITGGQSFYIPSRTRYVREAADGYLLAGFTAQASSYFTASSLALAKITKQGQALWNQATIEFSLEINEVICTGFGLTDTSRRVGCRRVVALRKYNR